MKLEYAAMAATELGLAASVVHNIMTQDYEDLVYLAVIMLPIPLVWLVRWFQSRGDAHAHN